MKQRAIDKRQFLPPFLGEWVGRNGTLAAWAGIFLFILQSSFYTIIAHFS